MHKHLQCSFITYVTPTASSNSTVAQYCKQKIDNNKTIEDYRFCCLCRGKSLSLLLCFIAVVLKNYCLWRRLRHHFFALACCDFSVVLNAFGWHLRTMWTILFVSRSYFCCIISLVLWCRICVQTTLFCRRLIAVFHPVLLLLQLFFLISLFCQFVQWKVRLVHIVVVVQIDCSFHLTHLFILFSLSLVPRDCHVDSAVDQKNIYQQVWGLLVVCSSLVHLL